MRDNFQSEPDDDEYEDDTQPTYREAIATLVYATRKNAYIKRKFMKNVWTRYIDRHFDKVYGKRAELWSEEKSLHATSAFLCTCLDKTQKELEGVIKDTSRFPVNLSSVWTAQVIQKLYHEGAKIVRKGLRGMSQKEKEAMA